MVGEQNDACNNDLAEMFLLDPTRKKRIVEYCDPEDVWKYIGGGKRLPGMFLTFFLYGPHHMFDTCITVQWSAWLTHTRPDPPSLEVGFRSCTRVTVLTCSNGVGTPS
jgi:hypothetical protein